MIEMIQSNTFNQWLAGLRDSNAKARIQVRLRRLSLGNAGDVKPVGDGISELRIDYGPGYRVYYMKRGPILIVLLCGGNKSSQARDIAQAKSIAAAWKE
ncbi:type II toxin-antitoxin system RelE/ParE family toxin [Sphingomonas sp. C8-2]|jgi:putative addiction module killer protein|nr:type II toxin-antitoxin system RelE/ParE family toxin [Sphingomonas sp. C8-2]